MRRTFYLHLLSPPDEYRLDWLLREAINPRTGKPQAGFETVTECQAEDRSRVMTLRATVQTPPIGRGDDRSSSARGSAEISHLKLDRQVALNLADRLEAGADTRRPQPTLASSVFMREVRLRYGGALLEVIDNNQHLDVGVFTAIHPSWAFPAHRLLDVHPRQIKNQFRTHLNRAGVTNAPGFLFGYLHGEFEPFAREFQLHFHGVCADDKLKAFHALRNKQGYVRTPKLYRPIVMNQLNDRPRQISYIIQSFWPKKARVPLGASRFQKRERTKARIREPYQSLYLMWLDKWKLSDLCELNGLRVQLGKMMLN
jgi:hypothetical protein